MGRPATSTWSTDFLLREGSSREEIGKWLKNKSIPWQRRRSLLQVVTGTFPCGQKLVKYGYKEKAECILGKKAHEESGSSWKGELSKETIGHIKKKSVIFNQEQCTQFCSKDELWEASKEEEMKIPWKEVHEGLSVSEDQYQERFWRRRLDGIGLYTVNREFLAMEFKRTQDTRSNYVEKATSVAQVQYRSLLEGLREVGQVKGWQTQQIVFVGGACGLVHVESFNKKMKALGFLKASGTLYVRS